MKQSAFSVTYDATTTTQWHWRTIHYAGAHIIFIYHAHCWSKIPHHGAGRDYVLSGRGARRDTHKPTTVVVVVVVVVVATPVSRQTEGAPWQFFQIGPDWARLGQIGPDWGGNLAQSGNTAPE